MPLVGFINDDDEKVTFEECWKRERFAGLPREVLFKMFLEASGNSRPDGLTVTGLLGCARKTYLERTEQYYENPRFMFAKFRGCVVPETPILTSALTWVPAGNLKPGDELLAFDEEPVLISKLCRRKTRLSTVIANVPIIKKCYRIVIGGREVVASYDHPWLVEGSYTAKSRARFHGLPTRKDKRVRGKQCWVNTEDLCPGDIVISTPLWRENISKEAGYLAGMYDGEGHVDKQRIKVSLSQQYGPVLSRVKQLLGSLGFSLYDYECKFKKYKSVCHLRIVGGIQESMRLLGTLQPMRLIKQFRDRWSGFDVSNISTRCTVESIEMVGEKLVAGLETSTRTYIANGLFSHNSIVHQILEDTNQLYKPGEVIAEKRFSRKIPHTNIFLSGKIDKYIVATRTLEDYKSIDDTKIPGLVKELPIGYIWQANMYKWIMEDQDLKVDNIRINFIGWKYVYTTGELCLLSPKWGTPEWGKILPCPMYTNDQIVDFIYHRAKDITRTEIPPCLPVDERHWCTWCPFKSQCWPRGIQR